MAVVGLTGGIGAGKSTVSARLADRGAAVIDADRITRDLQRAGQPVFEAMVDRFGRSIVGGDGELDRPVVAGIVFADAVALADLNAIVHPAVGAELARQLEQARTVADLVVLDVPLLVESGREGIEGLVVVDVDPEVAVARLVAHRGFAEADARARIAAQASREERLARADLVIDNGGDLSALEYEIERCWRWMRSLVP